MPDWAGTPLDQNGLFINYEYPTVISYRAILKFMLQRNPPKGNRKKMMIGVFPFVKMMIGFLIHLIKLFGLDMQVFLF